MASFHLWQEKKPDKIGQTSPDFSFSFLVIKHANYFSLAPTIMWNIPVSAAIIRGNHTNCSQFAQAQRLNWLFSKLGSQAGSEGAGMMDVLYCILNDSPEALNMMQEEHIKVIISLLEKFGRDPKVLDILSNLCVGSGVAVRSSQNNIVDFLLPGKNLLLHTAVVNYVARSVNRDKRR